MKKTDITKNSIIDSATKLLRSNGSITVKEISEDANVNIAAINYHFGDKDTLINLVIRKQVDILKSSIDSFLNQEGANTDDLRYGLSHFLSIFYDFVYENMGVVKYILNPINKDILESTSEYFLSIFAMDTPFTARIFGRLAEFGNTNSPMELKVKYALLFSSLAFPLVTYIRPISGSAQTRERTLLLNDEKVKEAYIKQLVNIILG